MDDTKTVVWSVKPGDRVVLPCPATIEFSDSSSVHITLPKEFRFRHVKDGETDPSIDEVAIEQHN